MYQRAPGSTRQERLGGHLRGSSTIRVANVDIPIRAYVAAFGFKAPTA